MAHFVICIDYRNNDMTDWMSRTRVRNKSTGVEAIVIEGGGFNADYNQQYKVTTVEVDYGNLLNEGSLNDRKRELAAWLANMAHETGGGWPTAPGGETSWGLFYNEEVAYIGIPGEHYATPHADFPPVPGISYHGRGPIQLTHNYNYGQMSVILYQDKNVLLKEPQRVVDSGMVGFMTSMWFWMTPQGQKPSCHEVMSGTWKPTQQHINAGWTQSEIGFGATIMVINGGKEGNGQHKVRRIAHYREILAKIGGTILPNEKLGTEGMRPL